MSKVFIVGGTGFLGYYAVQEFLKKGWKVATVSLPPMPAPELLPSGVECELGDMNQMSDEKLLGMFKGCDAFVFAAGKDERIIPQAPAYEFYKKYNVDECLRLVNLARQAGVKKTVILNSYFAYFARIWPELKLEKYHPYVRSRIEQAAKAIEAGGKEKEVVILELPYIFGTMPGRKPIWTLFTEPYSKMKTIFYMSGGTACVTAKQVGQAIVGAVERGKGGERYPVGGVNLTWKELFGMFMKYMGPDQASKKLKKIPSIFLTLNGMKTKKEEKKQGKESGGDPVHFVKIMRREAFLDADFSMKALGYGPDDLEPQVKAAIEECMK